MTNDLEGICIAEFSNSLVEDEKPRGHYEEKIITERLLRVDGTVQTRDVTNWVYVEGAPSFREVRKHLLMGLNNRYKIVAYPGPNVVMAERTEHTSENGSYHVHLFSPEGEFKINLNKVEDLKMIADKSARKFVEKNLKYLKDAARDVFIDGKISGDRMADYKKLRSANV